VAEAEPQGNAKRASLYARRQEGWTVGPIRRRTLLGGLLSCSAAAAAMAQRATTKPIRVAAASDLKFALAELATQYERQSGVPVQLSLGSSGQFAQQIRQGLPVDLYMAADEAFVFPLADAGLTLDRGAVYALGRIAFVVPAASRLALEPGLPALRGAVGGMRHFAIANPEHAPYGRAAQEALQHLGLWQALQPKLVLGENVAQATQYVSSGAADAGITALALALAPEVARLTRSLPLPAEWHAPLRQRMVLLRAAAPAAADFYRFLQSAAARAALARHGFGAA
jgi:molybdate transport system substrate-binding protein